MTIRCWRSLTIADFQVIIMMIFIDSASVIFPNRRVNGIYSGVAGQCYRIVGYCY